MLDNLTAAFVILIMGQLIKMGNDKVMDIALFIHVNFALITGKVIVPKYVGNEDVSFCFQFAIIKENHQHASFFSQTSHFFQFSVR